MEPTHYSPLEYKASFARFHKRCPEGYELLRHTMNLCYTSELYLREYWFNVFNEHIKTYECFMDDDVKQAYFNIKHEAYKRYLGDRYEKEKM